MDNANSHASHFIFCFMIYGCCCHPQVLFLFSLFTNTVSLFIACSLFAQWNLQYLRRQFAVVNKSFSKVLELHTHELPADVYVVYIHFVPRNLRHTSMNNKRKFPKIFDDETNLELELVSHTRTHPGVIDCLSRRVENSKPFSMDQNYGATRFAYKNISLNNFSVDSMDSGRFRCLSSLLFDKTRAQRKSAQQNT